MISLAAEMTESKGRHARGWLFFDAECEFCTRIARWLALPMKRRGLAVAPLQDPRVGALLGLSSHELLHTIRFVLSDGSQCLGAAAMLAVAGQLWWARPLVWLAKLPGMMALIEAAYDRIAQQRRCPAQSCAIHQAALKSLMRSCRP
jgi:predicted DCC family thiol-disulfide oxidoreductase YuxK